MAIIFPQIALFLTSVVTTYLAFSYALGGYGPLCWIAPPLLAFLAHNSNPRKTAVILGCYSMFCWACISWWLANGVNSMNSSSVFAGYLVVATLSFLSSIPYWVGGYIAGRFGYFSVGSTRPLSSAALLTILVELWPARLPGSLGHCLYKSTTLIQLAELGGAGLLSFLVYSTGFCLTAALLPRQKKRLRYLGLAVAPLALACIFGSTRLSYWSDYISRTKKIAIAMVQPNLPIKDIASPNSSSNSLETLLQQSRTLLEDETKIDLLVWPEIPIYFSPINVPDSKEALDQLLANKRTPLILNADMFTNETVYGRVPYYNTVQLFQGNGEVKGEYRKMILVPFGEYLPFENWMTGPRWERFLAGFRRYVAGETLTVLEPLPGVIAGTPVCLEALHTEQVAAMVTAGANILINPANDAYFGTTRGAEIDFALTVLRAVEFRIPLVRVSNSGISAFIDQRGVVDEKSLMTPFTADTRIVSVAPSAEARVLAPKIWGLIFFTGILLAGTLVHRRQTP